MTPRKRLRLKELLTTFIIWFIAVAVIIYCPQGLLLTSSICPFSVSWRIVSNQSTYKMIAVAFSSHFILISFIYS
jgi:hypothetical protein